ncbi:DNA-binding transcriptional regulator, LysR family [Shimia gijangensis]|uniref:DNA-binding transcriptional regulator, LysR family n=1 Tax=Shimia gijangensis TaxID=1470563 RepID=A0A1M6HES3_9RHOB|nr:LysR family transcriptional regulator [Shimia gijangensis]SHJ20700.1 DNA-binding transcriptional regulator, LysR family [Shimia gijangensis]
MDEKLLQTFLAVAETHSFHRAADRLNVTQAAISSRVRTLERSLEATLFERGPGGTRLSEAGQQLRPQAEQMLAQWQQLRAGLGRQHSNRIALRLGCQLSIWDSMLVDLTIWAEESLGKLPLSLNFDHESNALDMLHDGVVDLVITAERPAGQKLAVEPLRPEPMVLVATSPCSLSDEDLPLFLNLQLGPEYDAAVREQLADRSGHLLLGNALMALHYMKKRGGIAFLPERLSGGLHCVAGAARFDIPRYAAHNPLGPSRDLVSQILPGLHEITRLPGS